MVPEDPPPCVVEPLFGADEEVSDTDDFVGELVAILLHVSTKGTSTYDVRFQGGKCEKSCSKYIKSNAKKVGMLSVKAKYRSSDVIYGCFYQVLSHKDRCKILSLSVTNSSSADD